MTKPRTKPFAPEVRERAVRLVLEHQGEYETQWAAIRSIAEKIGGSGLGPPWVYQVRSPDRIERFSVVMCWT